MVEAHYERQDKKYVLNAMQLKNMDATVNKHQNADAQITVVSSENSSNPKGLGGKETYETDMAMNSGRKCPSERNMFVKFLLCFGLISNGRTILSLKVPGKVSDWIQALTANLIIYSSCRIH